MVNVSLLGEQAITDEATGNLLTRSSRAVAVVAFLVAHSGTPQTRQRIAGLLWPDSTDAQALTNLRRELHTLRGIFAGEPALVVTSTHLAWRESETSHADLLKFQRGRAAALAAAQAGDSDTVLAHGTAAIGEYRGEFLPGSYEDWVVAIRSELERDCVELCTLVCEHHVRRGQLAAAVSAARRRIALQPLEEAGYRTLMELQAEVGDRAGAVRTYHHCASLLERELGVLPDATTRRTLERLLARRDTTSGTIPRQSPPARVGPAATEVIGRDEERLVLQGLWQRAASGRPTLAIVRGSPGVGKTRLVTQLAEGARSRGAVVASTQCFGTSGRLALSPIADWLRTPAVLAAAQTLDPVWRTEVERLLPTQSSAAPSEAGRSMADAWQRHRFFEGIARAMLAVQRPLLLVLDNLQWCDPESLAFITFLLGFDGEAPLLVACTRRDEDDTADPEVPEWTVRMRASGRLSELSLGPLDAPDTTRLAAAVAGTELSAAQAALLQGATGGFPLYIIEAMRAAASSEAPAESLGNLSAVLGNRLQQASSTAQQVAGLAAAVGRNFSLDLLTEASDLEADSVVRGIDELWRRRIITVSRDSYDFSHDLLRDAAYAQVSPPLRWLLHRRLAQGLELLYADNLDAVSAELAEQYARAGRPERAISYYRRAAEVALGWFANTEAIRLLREALSLVRSQPASRERDRQEAFILKSMAAPLTATFGYASLQLQEILERSVALAEKLGDQSALLEASVGLWTSRFVQGRINDGLEGAQRAVELAAAGSDLAGPAHFAVAGSLVSLGRPAEALEHFRLATLGSGPSPAATIVGTRHDVHSCAWAAHAHWLMGDDEAARRCRSEALELAREIEHPYSVAVALAYAAITLQMQQELPALRETVAELRELCERYGFAYYSEWALVLDGWSRSDGSGVELARRGVEQLKAEGSLARMPYWLALLADVLRRHGELGAAKATLDAALAAAHARDDVWWLPEVMRERARYDEPDAAVARLRSAAAMARAHGSAALVRRCEADLQARGVRPAGPSVRLER